MTPYRLVSADVSEVFAVILFLSVMRSAEDHSETLVTVYQAIRCLTLDDILHSYLLLLRDWRRRLADCCQAGKILQIVKLR